MKKLKINENIKSIETNLNNYNLSKITTINNYDVYGIYNKITKCTKYFYFDKENKHVLIGSEKILIKSDKNILNTTNIIKNINYINNAIPCKIPIDLNKAKEYIDKINEIIKIKCPNLYINLDYIYNMSGYLVQYTLDPNYLLLCLFNKDKGCISSIELLIKIAYFNSYSISSKTNSNFENKKYNKLLRCIIILLMPLLGLDHLNSFAINPISAWLLITYYNATIPKIKDNNIFFKWIGKKEINKETLFEFFKDSGNVISLKIIPDEITLKNAEKNLYKIVNHEIIC
jgi:hypothetical protein